jgi:hypothetical protein
MSHSLANKLRLKEFLFKNKLKNRIKHFLNRLESVRIKQIKSFHLSIIADNSNFYKDGIFGQKF